MKQVLIFPTGSISVKEKERLRKEGIVAIEADFPASVVSHIPSAPLATGDDLLMSAMDAVVASSQTRVFAESLHTRMKAKEKK